MKDNLNEDDNEFDRTLEIHRRNIGWIYVILGTSFLGLDLIVVLAMFDDFFDELLPVVIISLLLAGPPIFFYIIPGIRRIKANTCKRTVEERKLLVKKIATLVCVIFVISIIFMITYNLIYMIAR